MTTTQKESPDSAATEPGQIDHNQVSRKESKLSTSTIDDEKSRAIAEFKAADAKAAAVDCGYPNCTRAHDSADDPQDWCHEIYLDKRYGGALYFTIYIMRGEYTGYMEVDYIGTMSAAEFTDEAKVLDEAAGLMRLYGERLAALNNGQEPERATLNHYMEKAAITRGIVTGEQGRALCGETFTASSFGSGGTSAPAPVCGVCQFIYDELEG